MRGPPTWATSAAASAGWRVRLRGTAHGRAGVGAGGPLLVLGHPLRSGAAPQMPLHPSPLPLALHTRLALHPPTMLAPTRPCPPILARPQ